jgi:DNA mismatch repair protein MSH3
LEYLVEVKHNLVCKVPDSWGKISNTKQVARFRTPFVVSTLPHLTYAREGLGRECKKAWLAFLDEFNGRFGHYQLGAKRVAELDCLLSLAELAREEGFCRPELLSADEPAAVHLWQARNVVVERLLPADRQFVPNDIHLGGDRPRAMLLTGPNMGGKSCLLRTVALTSILAQIGSFVPAARARLSVIDAIHVRTGARDDIFAKKSTLMVEMEEASFVLATASARSLVLMDELGRGTSTSDGTVIARSVLRFLARSIGCLIIFVTHFKALTALAADPGLGSLVANWHMGYARDSKSGHDDVLLLYRLGEGASESSFGLNVARAAGLPEAVLQMAAGIAAAAEQQDSLK